MKIALLGAAGSVGQPLSLLLKMRMPSHATLALYDINPITPGIAVDLNYVPTTVSVTGYSGTDATMALLDAKIVIIAAGAAHTSGIKSSELLTKNAKIIQTLVQQIAQTAPFACICIITNPLNSMVVVAAETLKKAKAYDKRKLFGITTLDIIRASTCAAVLKGQPPQAVLVPVIGGHSTNTILPLLSQIDELSFTTQEVVSLTQRIQNAETEILHAKAGESSASLSMAYATTQFILSLMRALQGASDVEEYAYVETNNGYNRFFAQRLRLNQEGIAEQFPIGILSEFEKHFLSNMQESLRDEISLGEQFARK